MRRAARHLVRVRVRVRARAGVRVRVRVRVRVKVRGRGRVRVSRKLRNASAHLVHLVVEQLVLAAQLRDKAPGCVHPAPPPLVTNADEEVA